MPIKDRRINARRVPRRRSRVEFFGEVEDLHGAAAARLAASSPTTVDHPAPAPTDRRAVLCRSGWHVKRQVCDLGDEQRVCRLARETGREQPVGSELKTAASRARSIATRTQLNLDFTWSLVVSVLTPLAVGETPFTVSSTAGRPELPGLRLRVFEADTGGRSRV